MNLKNILKHMKQKDWKIYHPALRLAAYLAPFAWFGTLIASVEVGDDMWLFVTAVYLAITYFALDTAYTIRDRREVEGSVRKWVYVFSCILVGFYVITVVMGFLMGLWAALAV